jgi:hypothetical protein
MTVFDRESASRRGMLGRSIAFQGRRASSPPLKLGQLAKEVKFFSICTNDSIPYTLVVDRRCENVAGLGCTGLSVVLR